MTSNSLTERPRLRSLASMSYTPADGAPVKRPALSIANSAIKDVTDADALELLRACGRVNRGHPWLLMLRNRVLAGQGLPRSVVEKLQDFFLRHWGKSQAARG